MRIVGACSLHRISSSSFRLYSEETHPFQLHNGPHTLKRKPFTRLRPPRDSIDLGDRIRMFWSAFSELLFVFCYDVRGSSYSSLTPPLLRFRSHSARQGCFRWFWMASRNP